LLGQLHNIEATSMEKSPIQQEKEQLRRDLRRPRSMPKKSEEEKNLLCQLLMFPLFQEAQNILLYHPLPHEPNLLALLEKRSHRFFFPRMHGDELELYEWFPEAPWITGPHRVQEPNPNAWRLASISEIDLALIPGIAFDPQGHRLGRGAGYFDRFLGKPECRALKVGIAWSWQILPKIPSESHDVKMDFVVTPEKISHSE